MTTSPYALEPADPWRTPAAGRAGDRIVFRVEQHRAVLARTPNLLDLAGTVEVPADQTGSGLGRAAAQPLAIIGGFISEFIPAVGTYIGGAIPILVTLGLEGFAQALIMLAYVVIYQQIENYWLSPRISAETMTLNGGVAFGAALAGGAIGGPMGAFMALPVAALITSFSSHYRKPREVTYESSYQAERDSQGEQPVQRGETS